MAFKFIFILSFCIFLFSFEINAKDALAQAGKAAGSQQSLQPASSAVHPITQAAVEGGVLTCTSRVNQISKFLTANTQSGAVLTFSSNAPDQHIFSASLEIIPSNVPSLYASTSFTPTPSGSCDAVYDTVRFTPESCAGVFSKDFKASGTPGVIKKDILILNAGSAKFFLMPAGKNGCVVIKKEVVQ